MKRIFVILSLALLSVSSLFAQTKIWQPSPGHKQIPIWPAAAPDALPDAGPEVTTSGTAADGKLWLSITQVSQPTITVYSPKGKNSGIAMLVCPGGGFKVLAMDLEGTEICQWLNSIGVTAVLLKYRVPTPKIGPYGESKLAFEDAQRAMGLVRSHATDWHIDPHKIGVIGFSAGGYLVAALSNRFDTRTYPAVDAADGVSCRPDFAIACYPGHLWDFDNDLNLNPNIVPTSKTPPTFLVQNEDDKVDGVEQALVYYVGLKKAGVPVEMHLYAQGGHGFGLRPSKLPVSGWPKLVEKWLGTIGIISH
jgi:acetyl esterase/lipase